MTILRIDASARHEGSKSRAALDRIEARIGRATIRRDLADAPLPQVDETWVGATFTPPEKRDEAQRASLALSDVLVEEVQAADTILISTPVYNFALPASLKAWVDQVGRVGVVFRYTADGPVGLLEGKRVVLAIASGGTRIGSEVDHLTPYLRFILGFFGITDVTFVHADAVDAYLDTLGPSPTAPERAA